MATACNDSNACTTETCSATAGCSSAPVTDGTACKGSYVCTAGVCSDCPGGVADGVCTGTETASNCPVDCTCACDDGNWNTADVCVKGVCSHVDLTWAQWLLPPVSPPSSQYTDNGDGTVTDTVTKLVWQQADVAGKVWSEALTHCQTNAAGLPGTGWRVPTVIELQSLIDFAKPQGSKMFSSVFAAVQGAEYWTSETVVWKQEQAWDVVFVNGTTSRLDKTTGLSVRCVR